MATSSAGANIMTETYTPWSPEGLPSGRLQVQAIHDDRGGLRLLLEDETGGQAEVVFAGYAAYRNVNESFRLRTWRVQRPPRECSAFTVLNSEWLAWLRQESDGVLDGRPLVHYAILTGDDCIDVAAESMPSVVPLK
jgi:hypothetical protein